MLPSTLKLKCPRGPAAQRRIFINACSYHPNQSGDNTVLTNTRIFGGSINCKWLAGWLLCWQLWSLTSRHCLDSTPWVYSTTTVKWREKEKNGTVTKRTQSSILHLRRVFVLFHPCWRSSLIILPILADLMTLCCFHFCVRVHMQRTNLKDRKLVEHNISCSIKTQFLNSGLLPFYCEIQRKQRQVKTIRPVIYPTVLVWYFPRKLIYSKILKPHQIYVKSLLHSPAAGRYQRKSLYGGCVSPEDTHLYSKTAVYVLHALRHFL